MEAETATIVANRAPFPLPAPSSLATLTLHSQKCYALAEYGANSNGRGKHDIIPCARKEGQWNHHLPRIYVHAVQPIEKKNKGLRGLMNWRTVLPLPCHLS